MPGFGESEEPKVSFELDDYVNLVMDFIKNQNIAELDLLGHSNGGRIIIKLMNNDKFDKEKVDKIILIGSAGIVHEKTVFQKFKMKIFKIGKKIIELKPIKNTLPNLEQKLKSKIGSEDYKSASPVMKQTLVNLVNENLLNYLSYIKAPTLLIWGEDDTATPISDAQIMEKTIPDAGLVKVSNCSHYVFLERAEYVNSIIKTFLEGENK